MGAAKEEEVVVIEKSRGRGIASIALLLTLVLASPDAAIAIPAERCSGTDAVRIQVTIEGIRSAKGSISIAIYGDQPQDFLAKGKKLRKLRLPAENGIVHGCLSLPRAGIYALTAYHDEDGDGHFTKNFFGLPAEGFAVSNGKVPLLGMPSFESAAITVADTDSEVTLKMQYPGSSPLAITP